VTQVQDWLAGLVQTSKGLLKMPKGIVWTAVISALAGIGSIVSAVLAESNYVLALGLVSVASALLASREK
jgi:hypothetical protein